MINQTNKFLPNSPTHAVDIPHNVVDLRDTPSWYENEKYLVSTSSGVEWVNISDYYYTKDDINTISGSLNDKINYIKHNILSFDVAPTYNGVINLLGWCIKLSEDPIELYSGELYEGDEDMYHSHIDLAVLEATGAPFTITISGTSISDVTGVVTPYATENITVTGTGHYHSDFSIVDNPRIHIRESDKYMRFDLYKNDYWDGGGKNFVVTGCGLAWVPDQNNWYLNFKIYKHRSTGDFTLIDDVTFDDADEYPRAADSKPGRYNRTDYDVFINGSDSEGIILEMDQDSIGSFYLEVRYSLGGV